MGLSPRQRVLCALNHEEPDRVPLFMGASGATSMMTPLYEKFKARFGVDGPTRLLSRSAQQAMIDERIRDRFGADGQPIIPGPAVSTLSRDISEDCFVDIFGTTWRRAPGNLYFEIHNHPLRNASQAGPMMSPAMYRRLIKPHHARMFAAIRENTRAKIYLHSCGNVYRLIEDFIEVGVDLLNPVQVSAGEMGDTARLKREFGDRLSFLGGIDTQKVLPFGKPEDVRAEVRRRIRDLAPGGGYIAAAVHCLQPDVPMENIIAMCDEVAKAGRCPLQI